MLSEKIREKIQKGKLKIYPVKYFWQVFELLTGVSFGAKKIDQKTFEKGSALARIFERLDKLESDNDED